MIGPNFIFLELFSNLLVIGKIRISRNSRFQILGILNPDFETQIPDFRL